MSDNEEVHFPTIKEIKSFGVPDKKAERFYNMLDKFYDYKISKTPKERMPTLQIVLICIVSTLLTVLVVVSIIDALGNADGIIRRTLPFIKIGS